MEDGSRWTGSEKRDQATCTLDSSAVIRRGVQFWSWVLKIVIQAASLRGSSHALSHTNYIDHAVSVTGSSSQQDLCS